MGKKSDRLLLRMIRLDEISAERIMGWRRINAKRGYGGDWLDDKTTKIKRAVYDWEPTTDFADAMLLLSTFLSTYPGIHFSLQCLAGKRYQTSIWDGEHAFWCAEGKHLCMIIVESLIKTQCHSAEFFGHQPGAKDGANERGNMS